METKRVKYPMFELVGPHCETPGCDGVLVDHFNIKERKFFKKCSACKKDFSFLPLGGGKYGAI
jgi:hypothetical protein